MTLREKVAEAIHTTYPDIKYFYGDFVDATWEECNPEYREDCFAMADAAIATVFDALLSDTAVEAAAEELFNESQEYPAWDDLSDEWDSGYGSGKNFYRGATRESLKAAQSALTADDAQTGGDG